MIEANIVKLDKPTAKSRKRRQATSKVTKTIKRNIKPAKLFLAATIIALLAISLVHLSEGVILLTGAPLWQGIAYAVGVDAMMVAVEFAVLTATAETRKEISIPAHALMGLAICLSAFLNALAFTNGSLDYAHLTQAIVGCAIP